MKKIALKMNMFKIMLLIILIIIKIVLIIMIKFLIRLVNLVSSGKNSKEMILLSEKTWWEKERNLRRILCRKLIFNSLLTLRSSGLYRNSKGRMFIFEYIYKL